MLGLKVKVLPYQIKDVYVERAKIVPPAQMSNLAFSFAVDKKSSRNTAQILALFYYSQGMGYCHQSELLNHFMVGEYSLCQWL